MNIRSFGFQWLFLSVLSSFASADDMLPKNLAGRWSTLDEMYSGAASLKVDAEDPAKGRLTIWSNAPQCNVIDAPVTVTTAGKVIVAKVNSGYRNSCREDITITLTRSDSADEYVGEIRQDVPAHPVLRVKLRPD